MPVGVYDAAIGFRRMLGGPGEQSRAEIETDSRIIVDDARDALLVIEDPRSKIGCVAFGGNSLVPVMVRIRGILQLYLFQPRIFTRRLIEMAMNTKIFHP